MNSVSESAPSISHRPRGKILLVDDQLFDREIALESLHVGAHDIGLELDVDEAEDGEHATDFLHLNSYDVVLTDGHMPNLDGMGLLNRIAFGFHHRVGHVVYHSGTVEQYGTQLMNFLKNSSPLRAVIPKGKGDSMNQLRSVSALAHPHHVDRAVKELSASTHSFFQQLGIAR